MTLKSRTRSVQNMSYKKSRRPQTSVKKRIEKMHQDLNDWGIYDIGAHAVTKSDMEKDLFDEVAIRSSVQSSP